MQILTWDWNNWLIFLDKQFIHRCTIYYNTRHNHLSQFFSSSRKYCNHQILHCRCNVFEWTYHWIGNDFINPSFGISHWAWISICLDPIRMCKSNIGNLHCIWHVHIYRVWNLPKLGLFGTLKLVLALQFIVMNAYFSVARTLTLVLHATLK